MNSRFTRVKFKRKSRSSMLEESEQGKEATAEEPSKPETTVPTVATTPVTTAPPVASSTPASPDPDEVLRHYPYYRTKNYSSNVYVDEVGNKLDTLGALLYAVLYRNRERYRSFSQILAEVRQLAYRLNKEPKDIRATLRLYLSQLPKNRGFILDVTDRRTRSVFKRYKMRRPSEARQYNSGRNPLSYDITTLPDNLR